MSTFLAWPVVPMPSAPAAPSTIDWSALDLVAASRSPFTNQQQIQDWQASWLEAVVQMPPMPHAQAQAWIAWLMGTRGIKGVFSFGDPLAQAPQGTGAGSITVSGGGQTGYSLLVTGGTGGGCLLPGDWMQIGLCLYRNLSIYNGGSQVLSIFPQIRESPLDTTAVAVMNTTGMFRLKANKRSWSVSAARVYGIQFDIEEAL